MLYQFQLVLLRSREDVMEKVVRFLIDKCHVDKSRIDECTMTSAVLTMPH